MEGGWGIGQQKGRGHVGVLFEESDNCLAGGRVVSDTSSTKLGLPLGNFCGSKSSPTLLLSWAPPTQVIMLQMTGVDHVLSGDFYEGKKEDADSRNLLWNLDP
ncbi:hypothetical protein STEG23_029760 [Scotinomys teguina]